MTNVTSGTLDNNAFLPRYSIAWDYPGLANGQPANSLVVEAGNAPYNYSASEAPAAAERWYRNQLLWRSPGSDTYLTMTTYHAAYGKAVVLFLNGTAKVVDLKTLDNKARNATGDFKSWRLGPRD